MSLLLISLKGYRIISFDVVTKFQTLLQICRAVILLGFTFLLNGLSRSGGWRRWITLFPSCLSVVAHLCFSCTSSELMLMLGFHENTLMDESLLCSYSVRSYLLAPVSPRSLSSIVLADNDLLPSSPTLELKGRYVTTLGAVTGSILLLLP